MNSVNDTVIDEIVAACNGDIRGALKALMLVNEQLEAELQQLHAAVAHGAAAERVQPAFSIDFRHSGMRPLWAQAADPSITTVRQLWRYGATLVVYVVQTAPKERGGRWYARRRRHSMQLRWMASRSASWARRRNP